jgi:hypothetical protein
MAVDKKSDHVGNHEGRYTDLNGHTKQFTYVDHDLKALVGLHKLTEQQKAELAEQVKKDRVDQIERLLALPASLCPSNFRDYTSIVSDKIVWNETMLRDPGMDMTHVYGMTTLIQNRIELEGLT